MLVAVIALQLVLLALVALLLLRRSAVAGTDPRVAALPDQVIALGAKIEATDNTLRNHLSELRREQSEGALQARHAAEHASRELREEIARSIAALAKTLNEGLAAFRQDNSASAEALRKSVHAELAAIGDRLTAFFAESARTDLEARTGLHRSLSSLTEKNVADQQALRDALQRNLAAIGLEYREASERLRADQREGGEKLRLTVEAGLRTLNVDNAAKLEEMRVTVDEKLQSTLNERLTQSFGTVSDQLTRVHTGLGEMKELATGVSDLRKVFSNVKSRGVVGEFQLGMQLEQMFSREQYIMNAKIKPAGNERVEYALKIPDGDTHMLLPIDAKFPREDWERLEHAYEHGTREEQEVASVAFERAIRTEGKRICEKYIDPPATTPYAVMFLPTEALYAEVMRRPGLQAELQNNCRVTVAGPSSFMAILTSLQMGFRTMAIQKKGNEVWNVLGRVKKEFGNFELLMNKVERNVTTVQNTLNEIGTRTRVITKSLHNVSELDSPAAAPSSGLLEFDTPSGVAPLLAAVSDEAQP